MMTAEDFMIRDVVFAHPDTTIRELLLMFATRKVSGAPVLDERRRLVGMVTVSDVLRHLQPHTHALDALAFISYYVDQTSLPELVHEAIGQPIRLIMTKRRLTMVEPKTEIEEISTIFAEQKFKKLPVVTERQEVVGVISRGDLIRYIVQELLKDAPK